MRAQHILFYLFTIHVPFAAGAQTECSASQLRACAEISKTSTSPLCRSLPPEPQESSHSIALFLAKINNLGASSPLQAEVLCARIGRIRKFIDVVVAGYYIPLRIDFHTQQISHSAQSRVEGIKLVWELDPADASIPKLEAIWERAKKLFDAKYSVFQGKAPQFTLSFTGEVVGARWEPRKLIPSQLDIKIKNVVPSRLEYGAMVGSPEEVMQQMDRELERIYKDLYGGS